MIFALSFLSWVVACCKLWHSARSNDSSPSTSTDLCLNASWTQCCSQTCHCWKIIHVSCLKGIRQSPGTIVALSSVSMGEWYYPTVATPPLGMHVLSKGFERPQLLVHMHTAFGSRICKSLTCGYTMNNYDTLQLLLWVLHSISKCSHWRKEFWWTVMKNETFKDE